MKQQNQDFIYESLSTKTNIAPYDTQRIYHQEYKAWLIIRSSYSTSISRAVSNYFIAL